MGLYRHADSTQWKWKCDFYMIPLLSWWPDTDKACHGGPSIKEKHHGGGGDEEWEQGGGDAGGDGGGEEGQLRHLRPHPGLQGRSNGEKNLPKSFISIH